MSKHKRRSWTKVDVFFGAITLIALGVFCAALGYADSVLGLFDWVF